MTRVGYGLTIMASMPSIPAVEQPPTTPERPRLASVPAPKTLDERFAEAHERVLDRHASTFAKLAK
jgi:hypothetical protein